MSENSEHFCEVIVDVFLVPNENYYYVGSVSVYLVNGAVVEHSHANSKKLYIVEIWVALRKKANIALLVK
jgi:hypothetical protein